MKTINYFIVSVLVLLNANVFAQYANLYVVGNACEAGWDPSKAIEMSQTAAGVFEWTGTLLDNTADNGQRGFKFLTQRGWDNSITVGDPNAPNKLISSGVEEPLRVNTGGNDNRFQVPENGEYIIVVNLNTMTMVCTKEGDVFIETPDMNHLFIIGSATPWDWDYENMEEMTLQEEGVFTWWGPLMGGDREFKFMSERNTWDKTVNPSGDVTFTVGSEYDLIYRPLEESPNDAKFRTTNDGKYFVYADLKNMRAIIDSVSTEHLYIVGGATPYGWDNGDSMEEMTRIDDGVFSWSGTLHINGDRQFKFLSQRGNWGKSINPLEDTDLEMGYIYNLNYRPKESSPNDFKFFVTNEKSYTLTVDLNDLSLYVSLVDGIDNLTAEKIFSVAVSDQSICLRNNSASAIQSAKIFDLTGRCLFSQSHLLGETLVSAPLAPGIYLVKATIDGTEYMRKVIVNRV